MTITLTSITAKQWKSIGSVALWLLGSGIVSAAVVYFTKDKLLGAPVLAGVNVVAYGLTQFFRQEETQALDQLPTALRAPVAQVAQAASDAVISKVVPAVESAIQPAYSPASSTAVPAKSLDSAVNEIVNAETKTPIVG